MYAEYIKTCITAEVSWITVRTF